VDEMEKTRTADRILALKHHGQGQHGEVEEI
jgi:hypothetical protein